MRIDEKRIKGYQSRFAYNVVKKALRNTVSPRYVRTEEKVKAGYNKVWGSGASKSTKIDAPAILHLLQGRPILCRPIDRRKYIIQELSSILSLLNPASVLEMGCGNGFNILALAAFHPEIQDWKGTELTEEGREAACHFLHDPPFSALEYVTGLRTKEITRIIGDAHISFSVENNTHMSHSDNSCDLVYTCQSIEQMPDSFASAFQEARRITRRYAVFIEGFREAQKNIFQRLHQKNADYFREDYHVVEHAGFKVLSFIPMALDKMHLSNAIVVCEK